MKGTIYTIKELGKVVYVGCSINFKHRKLEHLHCLNMKETKRQPIHKHMVIVGVDNFSVEMEVEKEFIDFKDMYKTEGHYIRKYDTLNNGFNYNEGGSASGNGIKNSNSRTIICVTTGEIFNCIKDACNKYNLTNTEMSSHLNKRRYLNGMGKNINGTALFFSYTDRESDGRILSEETNKRVKISNQRNCKKILDINTGEIFNSLKDACDFYGMPKSTLSCILNYGVKTIKYKHVDLKYIN